MTPLLLLASLQAAAVPDVGYEDAFPGLKFERIVGIATPRDGTKRLYFIEQFQGKVLLLADGIGSKEAKVVLDIEPKVRRRGNEEGLLGFAFHPKVKDNRKVYLQYSTSTLPKDPKNAEGRRNVLSEFKMDAAGISIDPKSERILLEIPQPFENHNGGVIQFGPDGFLYLGMGDGGAANDPQGNGQNRMSLLGKFLRIDVDAKSDGLAYGIPKDNPFVGKAGWRPEIWSLGWRNPWGFHFDRKTGELWSGDVGQELWEEICVVVKGGNYGWNVRESFHEFKATKPPVQGKAPPDAGPFVDPVVEHDHVAAKSITGGCVYRGKAQPKLDGVYFYGDFVTGNMWGLTWDGKKMTANKLLFTHPGKQIAIFGEDADGEVLWSSFDGKVYRFTAK